MKNIPTCGEALVALLEKYGVEVVFGIPGVHTLELYRGLVGSRIRHVLPRHEQGAGFMADGYARASGKPGVCFLITGPGVTNATTPIAQAYSDSIPMLVISSVNEVKHLGRGRGELHELPDQQKLMSACTAFSARAETPGELPGLIASAFEIFQSRRPRPVHIEVPIDIFDHPVEETWEPVSQPAKPQPDADLAGKAATLLAHAKRPVFIAGGGATGGEAVLLSLAEKLAAPVANTTSGSGVFPGHHPLSLGSTLVSQATHDLISKADVVLAVGTELSTNETWGIPYQVNGKLIRIDIDPVQFSNTVKADIELLADGPATLRALDEHVGTVADADAQHSAEADVRDAVRQFNEKLNTDENARRSVFETVVGALPDDALVACDMTQIGYTGHSVFRSDTPGRMLFPQGYGTLGYGLPAGLGAQIGAPQKPVVVFAGDGGLLYTVQEMATAVEEKLPVVLLLWNNGWLAQIREGFEEKGIEPIAVHPANPDFQALAKSFGWRSLQTDTTNGLDGLVKDAYEEALENGRPVMIEYLADRVKNEGRWLDE